MQDDLDSSSVSPVSPSKNLGGGSGETGRGGFFSPPSSLALDFTQFVLEAKAIEQSAFAPIPASEDFRPSDRGDIINAEKNLESTSFEEAQTLARQILGANSSAELNFRMPSASRTPSVQELKVTSELRGFGKNPNWTPPDSDSLGASGKSAKSESGTSGKNTISDILSRIKSALSKSEIKKASPSPGGKPNLQLSPSVLARQSPVPSQIPLDSLDTIQNPLSKKSSKVPEMISTQSSQISNIARPPKVPLYSIPNYTPPAEKISNTQSLAGSNASIGEEPRVNIPLTRPTPRPVEIHSESDSSLKSQNSARPTPRPVEIHSESDSSKIQKITGRHRSIPDLPKISIEEKSFDEEKKAISILSQDNRNMAFEGKTSENISSGKYSEEDENVRMPSIAQTPQAAESPPFSLRRRTPIIPYYGGAQASQKSSESDEPLIARSNRDSVPDAPEDERPSGVGSFEGFSSPIISPKRRQARPQPIPKEPGLNEESLVMQNKPLEELDSNKGSLTVQNKKSGTIQPVSVKPTANERPRLPVSENMRVPKARITNEDEPLSSPLIKSTLPDYSPAKYSNSVTELTRQLTTHYGITGGSTDTQAPDSTSPPITIPMSAPVPKTGAFSEQEKYGEVQTNRTIVPPRESTKSDAGQSSSGGELHASKINKKPAPIPISIRKSPPSIPGKKPILPQSRTKTPLDELETAAESYTSFSKKKSAIGETGDLPVRRSTTSIRPPEPKIKNEDASPSKSSAYAPKIEEENQNPVSLKRTPPANKKEALVSAPQGGLSALARRLGVFKQTPAVRPTANFVKKKEVRTNSQEDEPEENSKSYSQEDSLQVAPVSKPSRPGPVSVPGKTDSSLSSEENELLAKKTASSQEQGASQIADDILFAYAKEHHKWLYEIYKMGGISIDEFKSRIKAKMQGGTSPQEDVDSSKNAPENEAFSSISRLSDKKFKK